MLHCCSCIHSFTHSVDAAPTARTGAAGLATITYFLPLTTAIVCGNLLMRTIGFFMPAVLTFGVVVAVAVTAFDFMFPIGAADLLVVFVVNLVAATVCDGGGCGCGGTQD